MLPREVGKTCFAFALVCMWAGPVMADTVRLKTGVEYKGAVDEDGTIVTMFDEMKRVVVRKTKVDQIIPAALEQYETFYVEQPLTVHTGVMPAAIVGVKSGLWEENGRRLIEFLPAGSSKPLRMTQAINELGPRVTRVRGSMVFSRDCCRLKRCHGRWCCRCWGASTRRIRPSD